jgi:hypothetical protein
MKIFEFDNTKDSNTNDVDKISPEEEGAAFSFKRTRRSFSTAIDRLENLGWYEINSGYFSTVFAHTDKKFVLKLNQNSDPGYDAYVRLILTHPNKYFPKISDRKVLKCEDKEYCVYLIEKLKEITENANTYVAIIENILNNPNSSIQELFPNGVPSVVGDDRELIIALKLIRSYSRASGYSLDIHASNIMQRMDGSLVITDPYSFFNDSRNNRTNTRFTGI